MGLGAGYGLVLIVRLEGGVPRISKALSACQHQHIISKCSANMVFLPSTIQFMDVKHLLTHCSVPANFSAPTTLHFSVILR